MVGTLNYFSHLFLCYPYKRDDINIKRSLLKLKTILLLVHWKYYNKETNPYISKRKTCLLIEKCPFQT